MAGVALEVTTKVTREHRRLFRRYVAELRSVLKTADHWWHRLVAAESPDRAKGLESVHARWPDGPASHPCVIAVIQKYHRACESLNTELADSHRAKKRGGAAHLDSTEGDLEVYPHIFLVDWLIGGETDDLADFLADLSYWPIGLDAEDRVG